MQKKQKKALPNVGNLVMSSQLQEQRQHQPKTKTKMKIYISTNSDSYGDSTDAQIEAIRERMQIIARELGIESEEIDTQLGYPDDSHDLNEIVFELAMDCRSTIPENMKAAVAVADKECPIPDAEGEYIASL